VLIVYSAFKTELNIINLVAGSTV